MKTIIMIEIENKELVNVSDVEHNANNEESTGDELKKFQTEFTKDLHKELSRRIKAFVDGRIDEEFMDDGDDLTVEGYENLDAYGTKITFNERKEIISKKL